MTAVPAVLANLRSIRVELVDDVLEVVIDHPDTRLNAVDELLHDELTQLMAALRDQRVARAVLLTADGPAFSAGGDYAWFQTLRSAERLHLLLRDAKQLIWDLLDIPVPVVCALNGSAVGLGAAIALLCDVIVMSDAAVLADPHVKVGVVAGDGGTAIWPLAVGPALAKQYLLTGDPVPAAEAHRLGLVNEIVAPAEVLARGRHWAQRLAAGAPLAVQYTKMAVNKQVKEALNVSFDVATAYEGITFLSRDHVEAIDAIRERRAPHFEGR